MQKLSFVELVANNSREEDSPKPKASSKRAIEKDGHCYHVITQSWCKEKIFSVEAATYRHNLLCRLCLQEGIVILFSVAMPTHTHEVFLTPDWAVLSKVIRILNVQVSRFIRNELIEKTVRRAKEEGKRVNEEFLREKERRGSRRRSYFLRRLSGRGCPSGRCAGGSLHGERFPAAPVP